MADDSGLVCSQDVSEIGVASLREIRAERRNGLGIGVNRGEHAEAGALHAECETAAAAEQINAGSGG